MISLSESEAGLKKRNREILKKPNSLLHNSIAESYDKLYPTGYNKIKP